MGKRKLEVHETKRDSGDLEESDSSASKRRATDFKITDHASSRISRACDLTSRKAQLMTALDQFLESSADEVDEDLLSQCRKTQQSLKTWNPVSSKSTTVEPKKISQEPSEVDRLIFAPRNLIQVTPWTAASIPPAGSLPPLPNIKDSALEKATFTHHGLNDALSYERLEWLGDAYIYLLSTHLIYHTFSSHAPGRMAQLRERLVKNETLANYARAYGFHKRLVLPPDFKNLTKAYGDVFEAYVGAVILADPENGFESASSWMKLLWSGTITPDIIQNERRKAAPSILAVTGSPGSIINPVKVVDLSKLPMKDRLQALIGSKGIKLYYKDSGGPKVDRNTKLPLFTVACYLDDQEDGTVGLQLGWGSGLSKRDAGAKAAEMAMGDGKIMKRFQERKRRVDEALRREREREAAN